MSSVGTLTPLRNGGRRAWTPDNPPEHIRRLVDWWVHERRVGESQADFAQSAGVSLQSVRNWMGDPRVKQMLGLALEESNASAPRVQMVLDMLYKRATVEEDVKAARTYLEAVGRMAPKRSEVDVRITDARGLSNEELAAELRKAVALMERNNTPELEAPIEDAEVVEED